MKQLLALAVMAAFAACNSRPPTPTSDTKSGMDSSATQVKDIQSPYPISYSSRFTMDDPKNAESLLAIWKAYDNANFSTVKDLLADTVELHLAGGMTMRASRDSIISAVQAYRNGFTAAIDKVNAIMAVKSTDKNEHWALIWGMETDTHKNGKVDSVYLQETWKFDQDGRTSLMYQFNAPAMAKK